MYRVTNLTDEEIRKIEVFEDRPVRCSADPFS